jgi:uncharacterized protein (TIGR00299 family) protein
MKIAYFDCASGISGDMVLGAFVDSGWKIQDLRKQIKKLKIRGAEIAARKVKRGDLAATKVEVRNTGNEKIYTPQQAVALIKKSNLNPEVKKLASAAFLHLKEAEEQAHGEKGHQVHFHQLSELDTIVDIVGAISAIKELEITKCFCSAINLGRSARFGAQSFPLPAPATLHLLKGFPVYFSEIDFELATPTGAAILKTLARPGENAPPFTLEKVGSGAGDFSLNGFPNFLRIILGQPKENWLAEELTVLETNIDDMSPLHFEPLCDKLFCAGALDVFITPVQMKKFRPGFLLSVIAQPAQAALLSKIIFAQTTTLGIRCQQVMRFKLPREFFQLRTKFGKIKVKKANLDQAHSKAMPEYADCRRIADKLNLPFSKVYAQAVKAARYAKD